MSYLRWKLFPPAPPEYLAKLAGYPPLLAQLLYNRGVSEPAQVETFLAGDRSLQGNPYLLPDVDKGVARVYRALLSGETIGIYGDFDSDGICSTALLVQALSFLGGKVIPYIPHRHEEGYGIHPAALEHLFLQGVSLVITADCGITSSAEVEQAHQMGMDMIITDHHSVPRVLPLAEAVLNPWRADSSYPFPELAGVGVAFKLLQALFRALGREEYLEQLLDLVALGTIADRVPLRGENRYLVKQGLEVLHRTRRIGLQELIRRAGIKSERIDVEDISWILGPRLNAAGRLGHAITSYNLLMTDSSTEAISLAEELEGKNTERQRLTSETLVAAKAQLGGRENSALLVVKGENFSPGIIGLVAGKLSEEFYRPAIVLHLGEEAARGSARSIPEFDIMAALNQCQDLLSQFGGHPLAAGFTVPRRNLDILEECLRQKAKDQIGHLSLYPSLMVDAEITLSILNGKVLPWTSKLAPFGQGNPEPVFLTRRVKVLERHHFGGKSEHLRLKLQQGDTIWQGKGFDLSSSLPEGASYLDIVYSLRTNYWQGNEVLELHILDFALLEKGLA